MEPRPMPTRRSWMPVGGPPGRLGASTPRPARAPPRSATGEPSDRLARKESCGASTRIREAPTVRGSGARRTGRCSSSAAAEEPGGGTRARPPSRRCATGRRPPFPGAVSSALEPTLRSASGTSRLSTTTDGDTPHLPIAVSSRSGTACSQRRGRGCGRPRSPGDRCRSRPRSLPQGGGGRGPDSARWPPRPLARRTAPRRGPARPPSSSGPPRTAPTRRGAAGWCPGASGRRAPPAVGFRTSAPPRSRSPRETRWPSGARGGGAVRRSRRRRPLSPRARAAARQRGLAARSPLRWNTAFLPRSAR